MHAVDARQPGGHADEQQRRVAMPHHLGDRQHQRRRASQRCVERGLASRIHVADPLDLLAVPSDAQDDRAALRVGQRRQRLRQIVGAELAAYEG